MTQLTAAIPATDVAAAGTASDENHYHPEQGRNTLTFTTPRGAGAISREVWTDRRSHRREIPLGAAPNVTDTLPSFEAPTDWADNYGTRLRGYITGTGDRATTHSGLER